MLFQPFRIKFHVSIAGGILATILLMASASFLVVLIGGNAAAAHNAQALFNGVSQTVEQQTGAHFRETVTLAVLASRVPEFRESVPVLGEDRAAMTFLRELLNQDPAIYSAYVGKPMEPSSSGSEPLPHRGASPRSILLLVRFGFCGPSPGRPGPKRGGFWGQRVS
jgi:hypothetical protein